MPISADELQLKLKKVGMVFLDVDGVLTDGRLLLTDDGREYKAFDAKDGFGIRALVLSGIKVAVITGRESEVVKRRCKKLGINDVCQGVTKKHEEFQRLIDKYGLSAEETCFVGDDINDIAVLRISGLPACVADAVPEVKEICDLVAARKGGRGAVREIAESILKSQGRWEELISEFS